MSFLKNIFCKKDEPIKSYSDFWNWFQANEKTFFNVVKSHKDIEKSFFDKLSPKLAELKDGYFYLTGMYDDNTVELVLTADGNTKNIVFVEELVEQAPKINGWKFTALKPAMEIENVVINMAGYKFDSDNLFFYSNDYTDYPDEIDICVIHNERTEENKQQIGNGTYIFLDNYLGELDFLNNIDNLKFISISILLVKTFVSHQRCFLKSSKTIITNLQLISTFTKTNIGNHLNDLNYTNKSPATNTGFASGGLTCKLGVLCFYSSSVLIDSFVLRNRPERKARKRCHSD